LAKRRKNKNYSSSAQSESPKEHVSEQSFKEDILPLLEGVLSQTGLELVSARFQNEYGGRVLRAYIDKPGGVTITDCTMASRHMGDILDVALPEDFHYRLEVSSPGTDRPLTKEAHYIRFIGDMADVRLLVPINGRAGYTGRIMAAGSGKLSLLCEGSTFEFNYDEIKWARLNRKN